MIKQPTSVKFFIPTTIEAFDATAEPTLEGIAGEDYLGNSIASGGQAINAMDGYARRTFQANTDGVATIWRIDAAMKQPEQVSALILNTHNLEDAYSAQVEDLVDLYYNSVDLFSTATLLNPTKEVGSSDIYLAEFNVASNKYWFVQINGSGLTGTAGKNALIGQVSLGKIYTFQGLKTDGGYGGEYDYPGIMMVETDAGIMQTERRYGKKPSWNIAFQFSTDTQFEDLQAMLDVVQNGLFPFWVSFDYDQSQPVIWRVRLEDGLSWSYKHGLTQPWLPSISIVVDV